MLLDKLNRLPNGLDFFGCIIRNIDLKLFLEFHDQLDRIEGVGTEIVDKRSLERDLFLTDTQLGCNDIDYSILD